MSRNCNNCGVGYERENNTGLCDQCRKISMRLRHYKKRAAEEEFMLAQRAKSKK